MIVSVIGALGWIRGLLGQLRESWQIVGAVGAASVLYLANRYADFLNWRELVLEKMSGVGDLFENAQGSPMDLGLSYRLANYVAPVDEAVTVILFLLGLALLVTSINVSVWLLQLGLKLFIPDSDD